MKVSKEAKTNGGILSGVVTLRPTSCASKSSAWLHGVKGGVRANETNITLFCFKF